MKKKTKIAGRKTPIRKDSVLDPALQREKSCAAQEARERMIERHKQIFSENPFTEVKKPVSYEDAYNHMTQDTGADDARNRMIERRRKNA